MNRKVCPHRILYIIIHAVRVDIFKFSFPNAQFPFRKVVIDRSITKYLILRTVSDAYRIKYWKAFIESPDDSSTIESSRTLYSAVETKTRHAAQDADSAENSSQLRPRQSRSLANEQLPATLNRLLARSSFRTHPISSYNSFSAALKGLAYHNTCRVK